jgi:hypothetical protein
MRSGLIVLFLAVLGFSISTLATEIQMIQSKPVVIKNADFYTLLESARLEQSLPLQNAPDDGCTYELKTIDENSFKLILTQTHNGRSEKKFGVIVSERGTPATAEKKSLGIDIVYKTNAIVDRWMEPQPEGLDLAENTPVQVQLDIGMTLDRIQQVKLTLNPVSLEPVISRVIECKMAETNK